MFVDSENDQYQLLELVRQLCCENCLLEWRLATVLQYCSTSAMEEIRLRHVVLALVLFRLVNAIYLARTFFVPDEYWQSLEVAHKLVFGYGYLTWEWAEGIRGYFHPLLFAALYKLLALTQLDSVWCLTVGPRILQSLITAWSDYRVFFFAKNYFSVDAAPWALLFYVFTWTSVFCLTRTLSNSLETALCGIALSYWPWSWQKQPTAPQLQRSFVFAALSCLARPTAALLWLPMTFHLLYTFHHRVYLIFIKSILPVAVISLTFSAILDSLCYGRLVIVQWNFVRFNVVRDLGAFYGAHPWHWYFSTGLPMLLGTTAVPMALGICTCSRKQKILAMIGLFVVCANSFITHKEFRFLLPLLPMASVYAGRGVQYMFTWKNKALAKVLVIGLLVPQFAASLYFGVIHQSGTTAVMHHLGAAASQSPYAQQPSQFRVLFLMPCHSTPFYSHMHRNVTMTFLTCPPSLTEPGDDQLFYDNPLVWLDSHYDPILPKSLPSHVVLFDVLEKEVHAWLEKAGIKLCAEFFHTHFPEGRTGRMVLLYCKQ